jgi:hypothetical protein
VCQRDDSYGAQLSVIKEHDLGQTFWQC